ncbi:MAG TPA: hypothetical protein VFB33_00010 [Candidatus Binataceae bacterium]|nr:hypothetical protein [Candidatus Binataceae bacterium]
MPLPIESFFKATAGCDALLFTTFSLDEQVLAELLRTHRVPAHQRIVVLHDVMKHHAPGFLRQHYPNSLIVAVEITGHRPVANSCPVFHSKIWLAVKRRPLRCQTLAAPSLNVTRYHLDKRYQTFETFPWWPNSSIPLNQIGWMKSNLLFKKRGLIRQRLECGSFVLDARNGAPAKLQNRRLLVIDVLKELLDGQEPIGCAAPFVSETAIKTLCPTTIAREQVPKVWTGARRDGTSIHAKLIETQGLLVLGSTNLTGQALGIGKFLNHETVVVVRRGRLKLSTLLRGFPREDYRTLRAPEQPGDPDEDDDLMENWSERRQLAIDGPATADIVMVDGRAEIRLKGSLAGARQVVVVSKTEPRPAPLRVRAAERLRFQSHTNQLRLAEHLLAPPVEVRGCRQGKDVWVRELDCASLWAILEMNSDRLVEFRKALEKVNGKRKISKTTIPTYTDVRAARRTSYDNPKLGHQELEWQAWLAGLSPNLAATAIPSWCIDLAPKLRRLDGA